MKRFFSKILPVSVFSFSILFLGTKLIKSILTSEETLYKISPIFSKALSIVKKEYVEETDPKKIFEGAQLGVLESLDPISSYLNPEELKKLKNFDNKDSGDIGIFAIKRRGIYQVLGVMENSPAQRAGVKVGDILSGINGESALLKTFHQLRLSFKGEKGTLVDLRWIRNQKKMNGRIEREAIYDPQWKVIDYTPSSQLISIKSIYPSFSESLKSYLLEQKKRGLRKVVFDLRNCWDGSMDEGLELAKLFIKEGKITFQAKGERKEEILLKNRAEFQGIKLELIIGKGTFGASEIFTLLVKSTNRGKIYGERTTGLTSFQQIFNLSNGSALLLKTKDIILSEGKLLFQEGIIPDKNVDITETLLKEILKNDI